MSTTYKEAFDTWKTEIMPEVIAQYGKDDYPALAESWNDYTDSLHKDGEFTDLQYYYCPAWDDEMPEHDGTHLLESMGVAFAYLRVNTRPDNLMADMPAGSSHHRVLIKRGNQEMTIYYSRGPAHESENPDNADVFNSLLIDTSAIDIGYEFEEWAENLGFNPDSREAERIFKLCQETLLHLKTLFSDSELDELRELFADY